MFQDFLKIVYIYILLFLEKKKFKLYFHTFIKLVILKLI